MAKSRTNPRRRPSGQEDGQGKRPKRARRRRPVSAGNAGEVMREDGPLQVRIVGGQFRARKLKYHGNLRVRPMKDRTREAVFNLIGPFAKEAFVVDLFAGTGAMALEAMSRGSVGAILVERHMPTVKVIQENVAMLGIEEKVSVLQSDTFFWARRLTPETAPGPADVPWLVFCCPPYAMYRERLDDITTMLHHLRDLAPDGSRFLIEAEIPFDVTQFWEADWRVREYAPAIVGYSRPSGQMNDDEPLEEPADMDEGE